MIGISAGLALAQWWIEAVASGKHKESDSAAFIEQCEWMKTARPTAVNLMFCCDALIQKNATSPDFTTKSIVALAVGLMHAEGDMCAKMAKYGASLIKDGDNILTHCNTGSLATIGVGTALGVIREAHKQGKNIHVYVDETRPLLQGGRLTAYELAVGHLTPWRLLTRIERGYSLHAHLRQHGGLVDERR